MPVALQLRAMHVASRSLRRRTPLAVIVASALACSVSVAQEPTQDPATAATEASPSTATTTEPLPTAPTSTTSTSTIGWKSAVGGPVLVVGGLTALGGVASMVVGALVLTTPTDPNQGPVGFGLVAGGLGAVAVGGLAAGGGGALIGWDLNDGE
jgi:hypothetical protein